MAPRGRPKAALVLTDDERDTLTRWSKRPTSTQSLALRSKIVLACATGENNKDVASLLQVNEATVGKWRRRFNQDRLDGLVDEPRPGAPRTITDDKVEEVIVKAIKSRPKADTHWSTRTMAGSAGVSPSTVGRIWRAFGLKPHLVDNFKLSNDPLFVDKVHDVVGLYLDPPDAAVVFCVDEKTQIQALNRTEPVLPMDFGHPEQQTSTYVRNGTTNLFAALNVATGAVVTKLTKQHRAVEFVAFLRTIDTEVPDDLAIHLIMDNVSTHKAPAVQRFLLKNPRFHLHFTPTYSSWLNLVERWFGELTNKKLRRSTHRSVKELETDIIEWAAAWNENPKPYVWTATADEILAKLARYCTALTVHHPNNPPAE